MRIALAVVTSVALALSCASRGSTPVAAPVDVTVADVPDGGLVPGIAPAPRRPASARCTARLSAGELQRAPTCNVDAAIVEHADGTLSYPCGGDGPAEARFGDQAIAGSMRGGYLRLEIRTNPDWHDGCGWESRQLIEGYPRDKKVTWKYEETLLDETHGGCFSPCDAAAAIEIDPDD